MGLQGKRSRIRFQPYKGLGTRTYKNSVFVSNIAYELTEKQFKELFEDQVGKVSFCEIFPEPDGLSTGCGCVEFENEEDVEKATINMKKFQVQGRGLIVRDVSAISRVISQNVFLISGFLIKISLSRQISLKEVKQTPRERNSRHHVQTCSFSFLVMHRSLTTS